MRTYDPGHPLEYDVYNYVRARLAASGNPQDRSAP